MAWLSNPWVVGIIGSVPSGFLVNWLSGLVLRKRENREYLQKVLGANREVVYAIRPGISEGQIPLDSVVEALIKATARRYGVEASDLFNPTQISEELTKEVMDSSFISSAQKSDYCAKLAHLAPPKDTQKSGGIEAKSIDHSIAAQYRYRAVSSTATLLGFITAGMTIALSTFGFLRAKDDFQIFRGLDEKGLGLFLPVLASLLVVSLSSIVVIALRESASRRRDLYSPARDASISFGTSRTFSTSQTLGKQPKPPKPRGVNLSDLNDED